jgi:hypothetical protein
MDWDAKVRVFVLKDIRVADGAKAQRVRGRQFSLLIKGLFGCQLHFESTTQNLVFLEAASKFCVVDSKCSWQPNRP